MLHAVTIRPVTLRQFSAPLMVYTRRVVAYRAECSCGERGPSRGNVQAASVWRRTHLARLRVVR